LGRGQVCSNYEKEGRLYKTWKYYHLGLSDERIKELIAIEKNNTAKILTHVQLLSPRKGNSLARKMSYNV